MVFGFLMLLPGKTQSRLFCVGPSVLLVFGTLLARKPRDLGAADQPWLEEGIWRDQPSMVFLLPFSVAFLTREFGGCLPGGLASSLCANTKALRLSAAMDFPQHSQHVLEQLNQQRQLGLLCDCTFVVDGVDFKAHKAVLAACSEYFKMLFVDQKDVVHLDISNAAGTPWGPGPRLRRLGGCGPICAMHGPPDIPDVAPALLGRGHLRAVGPIGDPGHESVGTKFLPPSRSLF